MGELTPFSYRAQQVRTIRIDGTPWFVLSDIATILGYRDAANAVRLLRPGQARYSDLSTNGGSRRGYVVNESGLYRLILRSNRAEAVDFQEWVEDEVLPSLRRTGSYSLPSPRHEVPQSFADALELAARQARELEAARPAVQFVQDYADTTGLYQMAEVAAILKVKGMGRNNLFTFLRDRGVLYRANGQNLPKREHIDAQRFELKAQKYEGSNGHEVATSTPYVTARGLIYIRDLLQRNGYECMGAVDA